MNEKEIYREAFASLIKDKEAHDYDNNPYGTIHFPGAYRILVDGNYETEFSAETDEEAIKKFKKHFCDKYGNDRYIWVYYDVWGNEEDGWEVNDISRFTDKEYTISRDADSDEVLKVLCAEGLFKREAVEQKLIEVDWSCSDGGYIEFNEADTGKPIGRIEKVDLDVA